MESMEIGRFNANNDFTKTTLTTSSLMLSTDLSMYKTNPSSCDFLENPGVQFVTDFFLLNIKNSFLILNHLSFHLFLRLTYKGLKSVSSKKIQVHNLKCHY